ncbi:MAG: hypothetical protein HY699_04155 [Deltaproteobacteria bacterium]|nr:hypothetical protein [Deltaproteobacteria bacterium]
MKTRPYRSTMLELVQTIQDYCGSDDEVVAVIAHMLRSGRVVLTGNFARRHRAALAA